VNYHAYTHYRILAMTWSTDSISASLCKSTIRVPNCTSRIVYRNLFCIFCSLSKCVCDAAAHWSNVQ